MEDEDYTPTAQRDVELAPTPPDGLRTKPYIANSRRNGAGANRQLSLESAPVKNGKVQIAPGVTRPVSGGGMFDFFT